MRIIQIKKKDLKAGNVMMWNKDVMYADPCSYYSRYKAMKAPMCACRPCLDAYLSRRRTLGDTIYDMAVPSEFEALKKYFVELLKRSRDLGDSIARTMVDPGLETP